MRSHAISLAVAAMLMLLIGGAVRCSNCQTPNKGRLKVGGMWVKSLSSLDQSGNIGPAASFSLSGSAYNVSSRELRAVTPTFTFYDRNGAQLWVVDTGWVDDSVLKSGDSTSFWSPLLRYDSRFAKVEVGFRTGRERLAVDSGSVGLPEGVAGFLRLR